MQLNNFKPSKFHNVFNLSIELRHLFSQDYYS